ncbi:MAG: hypothetical protein QX197_11660 [Methylococcaceae bacterium]
MKIKHLPTLLASVALLSFGTSTSAAPVRGFEFSPNVASIIIPFSLSSAGYVNNQTVTASVDTPQLGSILGRDPTTPGDNQQPYSATPLRSYIFTLALDDNPNGGSCMFSDSFQLDCLDGYAPAGSEAEVYNNIGDSDQEYLQVDGGQRIAIDTPAFAHLGNPNGSNNNYFGTILGDLPLNALTSSLISKQITVTGDLFLTRAYLAVDYSLSEAAVSQTPIPSAIWLFASALFGLLGMQRKSRLNR